jgi:5-methylcytosine-specific restriction protein B
LQDEEFKLWLQQRGAESENGRRTRVHAVRTIENNLGKLGSPHADLEAAWKDDRFDQLRRRLKELREDFEAGGTEFRALMPQAEQPGGRLSSWRSWLAQYGQFLAGEPQGDKYADRIREYVLEHYIEAARERDEAEVEVLVSDVNSALGLNQAWPNICQALKGQKFLTMADVAAPVQIGADQSSATRFRFSVDGSTPANIENLTEAPIAMSQPTNLILYGPPGTGKTYATAREAVRLCGEAVPSDRDELMAIYRQLLDAGCIEFVTFHQSVAYEDFVEGLRPTQTTEEGAAGFELKVVQGVFRRIARRAETSTGTGDVQYSVADRQIFKMSIGEAFSSEDAHLFEEAIAGGYTLLGFEDIDWTDARFETREAFIEAVRSDGVMGGGEPTAASGRVQMPFIFRNWLKVGDIVVVSKGNSLFRAIGEVTGDYQFAPREGGGYAHRRAVKWLWVDRAGVPVSEIYGRSFSQKSIYLLDNSDLNRPALERYIASQQRTGSGAPESFVLIIDEINRANISKVFGELITLLEPDKRLGQRNALRVRLPYSAEMFGVPANLHVIGTMNTADRSIALLDTALRRRFEFRELMPDPTTLGEVDGIDLGKLLATLNERIEYLFDREHQIGHAYFIGCSSRQDVDAVMRHKVIPLLAEYFYEDWSKVAAVLGDATENEGSREGRFIDRVRLQTPRGMSQDEDSSARYRWKVRDVFSYEEFAAP